VTVQWPPEVWPRELAAAGRVLGPGTATTFTRGVTFGPGSPVRSLPGRVRIVSTRQGWRVTWTTPAATWVAAAVAGEMGESAPPEAQRALASVLWAWLDAHPRGNHPDGSLCPLTHCAVVRGDPEAPARAAATTAPALDPALDPAWICFCASKGGVSLSPRQVWGRGPSLVPPATPVPLDPWASWTRTLSPAQVGLLKRKVRPQVLPDQAGLRLGLSGPYPVEELRLAAGRAFGWRAWPSDACRAEALPDGSLRLEGHGWGHNVGLCLASAQWQAARGMKAEAILRAAFGGDGP
jgi:hypothetical protein